MSVDRTSGAANWKDATQLGSRIDLACDRFEAAWRAGARPQIEDFLAGAPGAGSRVLLRYLLMAEVDYRASIGEYPEPTEYRLRFPGRERLIDSVFATLAGRSKRVRVAAAETIDVTNGMDARGTDIADRESPGAFPSIPSCEILCELGRGGMGIVYKARQIRLNRVCALKIARPDRHSSAEARARFFAEAEIIARLRHPNLVQIYNLGEHDGRPYFEMEYIEGGSLARRLDGTPWAPRPSARMVAALARAIGEAHRLGVVHRDLKPANVLLKDDETPMVVDFGLAKSLETDSDLTQTGVFVGTPSYAAPEQIIGSPAIVGPATDIYALGAIFYHMLTGRPPFQGATVLETLEQVESAEPVPPSRLQPGVPRDVETIALKCLAKDPGRRYAGAAALAEDLDRFLSGRAIVARPIGAAERAGKWIRRQPVVAALSAAVVAVALLGFVLVTWQWRRAEAKASAEAAANQIAQRARKVAFEEESQLAFHQAMALCDHGEVERGILWLARSLELSAYAGSDRLARPIRVNLADWTGQLILPLRLPPLRHSAPIVGLAFRDEGKTLVSVGRDGIARFWDTATGQEHGPPVALKGDSAVKGLELAHFAPDESNLLATVNRRGQAALWDLNKRQQSAVPHLLAHDRKVQNVVFQNDQSIIICYVDGTLEWRALEGDAGSERCQGVTSSARPRNDRDSTSPAVSRGRKRSGGGSDCRAPGWDAVARRYLEERLHHDSPVEAIALTPDCRMVVTARRSGRLRVWDAETERGFDLAPQGTDVTCLTTSLDGRIFASGTEGGIVRVWDMLTLGPIGQTCKLSGAATAIAVDTRARIMSTGEDDGTIRMWKLPSPKTIGFPFGIDRPVQTLTFDKLGRRILIGTSQGVQRWDLTETVAAASDRRRGICRSSSRSSRLEATAVSPDNHILAIARHVAADSGLRGRIELRDAATGKFLRQTPDQTHALLGFAFSSDSKWVLAWGAGPTTARLWEVGSLRESRPILQSLDSAIHQAVFSTDGRSLLLGCRDGKARLWDVRADVEIHAGSRPRHAYPITAVAFDADRARVVTGCHAGTVRFWDSTRGTMVSELRQNAGEIAVLAFSPDETVLIAGSYDGTARFLDSESGRQLGPALHHTDAVLCVAFDPDGQSVATGTRDGMVQRFSMPSVPDRGDPDEIRRRIKTLTGIELDFPRADDGDARGSMAER
jgi:WD40 repeat protein/tRNA A-37 threonylcarbamoyl transferase component Bud32